MEAPLPHPIQISSPSGFGFSEMESETSSRDSDSSHESRLESVRRRRKFVPARDDDPDAEPLLQLRVTASAWSCLKNSPNLEPTFYPSPVLWFFKLILPINEVTS